jgi:hypothetical protein
MVPSKVTLEAVDMASVVVPRKEQITSVGEHRKMHALVLPTTHDCRCRRGALGQIGAYDSSFIPISATIPGIGPASTIYPHTIQLPLKLYQYLSSWLALIMVCSRALAVGWTALITSQSAQNSSGIQTLLDV